MNARRHAGMYIHKYKYKYEYKNIYIYIYMYVSLCVCVCECVCVCRKSFIDIYMICVNYECRQKYIDTCICGGFSYMTYDVCNHEQKSMQRARAKTPYNKV